MGEKRLKAVKVRLCDWLFCVILRDRQVHDYASTYFHLRPIERRSCKFVRSTCVDGERLEMELQTLKLQIGYQNPLPNFRIAMHQIAAINTIPDYDIVLIEDAPTPVDADAIQDRARKDGRKPADVRVIITKLTSLLTET